VHGPACRTEITLSSHQPARPDFRLALCAADIGRRVTIRAVRPEDGTAFDSVGPLVAINDHELSVDGRHGVVTLSRASSIRLPFIVAGKVIAPDISAINLQLIAQEVWPPRESELLGDWNLRWAGAGERSDSVRVGGDPGIDLAAAIDYARAWYHARDSEALLQVPSPWLGDELAAVGCQPVRRVVMMTAATTELAKTSAQTRPPGLTIELAQTASAAWAELALTSPIASDDRYTAYATATLGGATVGIGRATLAKGWCGITSIATAPNWQRQGIAQAVTAALIEWAATAGVSQCFLQVLEENEPARALYSGMGFATHHHYAYWQPMT